MKLLLRSHVATKNFKMLLISHVGGSTHQTSMCIINSEETPVKAVMNKLIERACTNYHEEAKTDLVAIHEVNRPSARSHLKSQFRQKHRDHEPSRV